MYTDEKLQCLHCDIEYKRTNSLLRNIKYSVYIVKNDAGSMAISISTSSAASLSINLIKVLWIAIKYVYITKEVIECRRSVIEWLLHDYYDDSVDIIKNSINNSCKWLEYNAKKLLLVKELCIEYLSNVDHRLILLKYSTHNKEFSEKEIVEKISIIEKIFAEAISEWRQKQLISMSYEYLITQPDGKEMLTNTISEAIRKGNLTSERREL